MIYYFYFIDKDKMYSKGSSGIANARAVTRENVYANKSDWVALTSAQTNNASMFLTSGTNMGRDNIVYNDKSYILHSAFLDISDPNNIFTVYVCIQDNREIE